MTQQTKIDPAPPTTPIPVPPAPPTTPIPAQPEPPEPRPETESVLGDMPNERPGTS
ncbi:hypothetical protein ACFFS4_21865 [Kutzneria kofuensis]|uniref:Uncharacterized protein n=1 Tax=Kutzneria kofuensis TaxID=103725 RepID=A0A7W9KRF6_9PSEU|nr:hypothetical protein [Kutzneria kofuensis]MBB5897344.1 hypothetical protein [Kutzneria kofuensis]